MNKSWDFAEVPVCNVLYFVKAPKWKYDRGDGPAFLLYYGEEDSKINSNNPTAYWWRSPA